MLSNLTLRAQEEQGDYDITDPTGTLIGIMGGGVLSSPRNPFPSVRIGVDSKDGTSEVSSDISEFSIGNRVGLFGVIGIVKQIAISLNVGMMKYGVSYASTPKVSLQLQTIQAGGGVQINVLNDLRSFRRDYGLRQIYADVGLEAAVTTLGNKVEAYSIDVNSNRTPATGSFQDSKPFDNTLSLHGALGFRYALGMHYELGFEGGYNYALGGVFNKTSLPDSKFTIDNVMVQVAFGYRF